VVFAGGARPAVALDGDAGAAPNGGDTAALVLFERSEAAYRAGRFAEAADLLVEAYRLKKEPILLYDLARAYEGLGDLPRAIATYERYLAAAPLAKNRDGIVQRIATLRAQVREREELERRYRAERAALDAEQARSRYRAAEDNRSALTLPPKLTIAAGAATLLVGGALGLLALSQQSTARNFNTTQRDAEAALGDARTFATGANTCFIAGGVLVAGGFVWLLVARRTAAAPNAPEPLVAPRIGRVTPLADGRGIGLAW
jgi:tetratricopeptide (TPR) repeat protein